MTDVWTTYYLKAQLDPSITLIGVFVLTAEKEEAGFQSKNLKTPKLNRLRGIKNKPRYTNCNEGLFEGHDRD